MKKISILLYCAAALTLSGCGDSTDSPATSSNSTLSTTNVSKGTVSVVGASNQEILVNNVTYSTGNASVTHNGVATSMTELKPGMQVRITGSHDGSKGTATRVEIEGQLDGVVGQVNATAGTFVLFGQTVVVNNQTVYDGISGISALTSGQKVEVYGLPDASGNVVATRLEVETPSHQNSFSHAAYLSGSIASLDSVRKTFTIGTITVNYSSATLPAQALANGLMVNVQGSLVNGVFKATNINSRDDHVEQGSAELEGLVSGYDVTAGTFILNSQQVKITSATIYSNGVVSNIANGVKVEVKGSVVNGILTASKVEIDRDHGYTAPTTAVSPTTPTTPVTSALDGATLYANNCASCHPNSSMRGKSASATQGAINSNRGRMGSLSSLTVAEIAAIAAW